MGGIGRTNFGIGAVGVAGAVCLVFYLTAEVGSTRKETRVSSRSVPAGTVASPSANSDSSLSHNPRIIYYKGFQPARIVGYAKTLSGLPYAYGGTSPKSGFDCSGFITYVFNHFGLRVPRSSVEFTNAGKDIPLKLSRPGDLILFTGTDSTDRTVGHMGIITLKTPDSTAFIHSTSGKAYGVTETPLNVYYQGRFVKVVRILDN